VHYEESGSDGETIGSKVAAAAARAAKDRQFKALQKGMGISLDKDEDAGE
jgi:hypothetical protein